MHAIIACKTLRNCMKLFSSALLFLCSWLNGKAKICKSNTTSGMNTRKFEPLKIMTLLMEPGQNPTNGRSI